MKDGDGGPEQPQVRNRAPGIFPRHIRVQDRDTVWPYDAQQFSDGIDALEPCVDGLIS
jgi:hypothetical protein